jgi:hypothetical protein
MACVPAAAQMRDGSVIIGTVSDQTGGVLLREATMTLRGSALIGGPRTTTTDQNGAYRFTLLAPGTYEVIAEVPSFAVTKQSFLLPLDTTLTVDFRLSLASIVDSVKVSTAPMLDVKNSGAITILDTPMLDNLPTTRFIPDLLNLAPGVTIGLAPGAPGNVAFGGTQGSNAGHLCIANTPDDARRRHTARSLRDRRGDRRRRMDEVYRGAYDVVTRSDY